MNERKHTSADIVSFQLLVTTFKPLTREQATQVSGLIVATLKPAHGDINVCPMSDEAGDTYSKFLIGGLGVGKLMDVGELVRFADLTHDVIDATIEAAYRKGWLGGEA